MKISKTTVTLLFTLTILTQLHIIASKLPVIAILANPEPEDSVEIKSSRVNMQYVRWLEESRANVVVIQPWHSESQIDDILNRANGVLWQGGDRNLVLNGQFENVARIILNKIIQKFENDKVSVPLWGTCQGFELLHALVVDSLEILGPFNASGYRAPLITNEQLIKNSKMFADLDERDMSNIQTFNVTSEYHHFGVNPQSYLHYKKLQSLFKITTLAKDKDGKFYVASIEGKEYPIYAVQFHPEMVQFTKYDKNGVADSQEAVKFAEMLSSFFIKESLKNDNRMDDEDYNKFVFINSFEKLPIYDEGYYYYHFDKTQN